MKVLCILLCVAFASGFYIDNNEAHEEKVVGGDYVPIVDVPYQASLFWFRMYNICGATIIDRSWVITAAHCVDNKLHISVRTGSGHREFLGKVHRIGEIIIHACYHDNSNNDDIALIKLAQPIQFSNTQQPIELAKPHDIPTEGEWMQISGFGQIGKHLKQSDFLKAAYIPIRNQENCRRAYLSEKITITDNMICAGNGDADACYGDSGGPGVLRGKLHGIISIGLNCTSTIFPLVFTRVYKYNDWIKEKTGLRF